jgi:hypothetical protein
MANGEWRMANGECRITDAAGNSPSAIRHSTFRFARPKNFEFAVIGGRRAGVQFIGSLYETYWPLSLSIEGGKS